MLSNPIIYPPPPITSYNSAELKALMTLHHESSHADLLHGALDFHHRLVADAMTPEKQVIR